MQITNLAVKNSIKTFLYTKIQLYKICVLCGVVFKTICAICVIRYFYLGEGLNKKMIFVVLLCVLCGLCGSFGFGEMWHGF